MDVMLMSQVQEESGCWIEADRDQDRKTDNLHSDVWLFVLCPQWRVLLTGDHVLMDPRVFWLVGSVMASTIVLMPLMKMPHAVVSHV